MNSLNRPWPLTTRNQWLLAAAIFVVVLALLLPIDHAISLWGQGLPPPIQATMKWVSRWGMSDWQLIPALIILLLISLAIPLVRSDVWRPALAEIRVTAGFVFLGIGVPSLTASLLKRLFGRARPEAWTIDAPLAFVPNWTLYDHQSFPSGHSTTAFAMAMVLVFIWPRTLIPALIAAVAIAMSRIVLGQHYATDVTAGAVLGTLGAYAIRYVFARRGWLFSFTDGGAIIRKPYSGIAALFSGKPQRNG